MNALQTFLPLGLCAALSACFSTEDPAFGTAELEPPPTMNATEEVNDQWDFLPPVTCGSVLPGPPIKPDVTEARPGYAEELATLDFSMLPDPIDYSAESKLAVMVINYMLGRSAGTRVSHQEALQRGGMGRAVLGAAAKGTAGRIDFTFLRRGLHYFYPCSRPLPGSLIELRRRYGNYKTWPVHELACARPKDGPRRIYESSELGVYIAETVVAGHVRETEVLFSGLRQDGQLDFAAYHAEGELTDRSTFATVGGGTVTTAAPYTCISCHLDPATYTISRHSPTGTGAGCR